MKPVEQIFLNHQKKNVFLNVISKKRSQISVWFSDTFSRYFQKKDVSDMTIASHNMNHIEKSCYHVFWKMMMSSYFEEKKENLIIYLHTWYFIFRKYFSKRLFLVRIQETKFFDVYDIFFNTIDWDESIPHHGCTTVLWRSVQQV